jgi:glycine/D-amino acid oxidase-like deaminating enzyme
VAEIREQNYWLGSGDDPTRVDADLPQHVDVAVIGAGFTGLSAARALARGGASVAVFEAESVGFGASSRNGGMVLPGLKLGASELIKKYGKDLARGMYQASMDSIDWVQRTVQEERIDCNFTRHGQLSLAAKPTHFVSSRRGAEVLEREFDHQVKVLTREQLPEEIGSESYFGGVVDECSAGVNPARYVRGLARAAERTGAKIYERCPAGRIAKGSRDGVSGWEISIGNGSKVFADKVVLATGAYSQRNLPIIPRKILPIGSFIIVTEQLSEEVAKQVIPKGRMISDSLNFLHYFRLTPDRRMLFGGRAAFFPANHNTVASSAKILQREMVRIFPQLKDVAVECVWGGTLDVTFDLMPHSGNFEGLHFIVGYAGHGVALASYLGNRLGENMLRQRWDDPFAQIKFPGAPLGLYDGRPWFLPAVGAWFKFLDWVS